MTHASENITLPQTSFAGGNQASPPTWNPESAPANTRELTYLAYGAGFICGFYNKSVSHREGQLVSIDVRIPGVQWYILKRERDPVADPRGRPRSAPRLRTKIFLISCSFWENPAN